MSEPHVTLYTPRTKDECVADLIRYLAQHAAHNSR